MTRRFLFTCFLVLAFVGCDNDTPVDGGTATDAGFDAFVMPPRTRETLPTPGALMAGMAEVIIPAPLGIGTMGFGAIGEDPNPTPFAETFPGTTRVHGTLNLRAVALSRGDAHQVIFVRMDTIGVFQQARTAVLDELMRRTGNDYSDGLVLAATHTHSGPGRLLMTTGALVNLGDTFLPEYYDNFINAIADVVERAVADQRPAEIGTAIATSTEGHSDRRCENDALPQVQENPDMPLIVVRRDGEIDAIVASYAYHGTILGIADLTLSGDMAGLVEQRISERFDHPVAVLFLDSWGADMAPGSPPPAADETGADQPPGYDRMERLGNVIADAIMPHLTSMTFSADVPVRARTYRVPLSTDVIGYDSTEFNYRHGGAFCGVGSDGNCTDDTPIVGLDRRCVPISPAEGLPKQTLLTAGEVGGLSFVTAPGEWSTALANGVLDTVRATTGGDVMMIGYSNDYNGYSLTEVDWFQGGYESSGALWGPRQGDYLAARLVEAFETFNDLWNEPPWVEPAVVAPFSGYTYDAYIAETPIGLGTMMADVPATAAVTDLLSFTVLGTDPWLGNPTATLEVDDGAGGGFVPVVRGNGEAVTSDSYDMYMDLVTEPTYVATLRADREFRWTFYFAVSHRSPGSMPTLGGANTYRFSIEIPTGATPMTIETGSFTVTP